MNPKKCFFGVASGKLLGFIVSKRGIEIDPIKVKAIMYMPPPKNIKELRGFLGCLQFVRRFISQHSKKWLPFTKLLKESTYIWDNACKRTFDEIKHCLLNPPLLQPLIEERPFSLYILVIDHFAGVVLVQQDEGGSKEHAIYYLSLTLVGCEVNYILVESLYLALVWATQKLCHYFLAHIVHYLAQMDPICYLFEKASLSN